MADENRGYRDRNEYRRRLLTSVWPHVIVVMLVFAISVLAATDLTWPLFAAGWAVALVCIGVAYLHPQLWLIAPFGALGAVLLIRWGTDGLDSGVGPLLLVPVLAVALYGSRRTLAAIMLLATLAVIGVHLTSNHAELVLTSVWRQDLIVLVLAGVLGAAVNDLVNRVRSERRKSEIRERRLETVSEITRAIATSAEPARVLCRKAVDLTGAGGAALFRQQAGEPELLAWENGDPKALRKLGDGPIRAMLARSGRGSGPQPVAIYREGSDELTQCAGAWRDLNPAAVVCAPAQSGDDLVGVLILAWPEGPPPEDSSVPLDLLAAEASISIRNFELTESLERLALTDPLTGAANRRGWEQHAATTMAAAERYDHPLTLAMLDLDGFKAFNDRHGHQAGDRLLIESLARWKQQIRGGDHLARYGGDEFVLTLPETSLDEALAVVGRMCRTTDDQVKCSAGVASWDGSETAAELLGRADQALYRAKSEGPGSIRPAEERAIRPDAPG